MPFFWPAPSSQTSSPCSPTDERACCPPTSSAIKGKMATPPLNTDADKTTHHKQSVLFTNGFVAFFLSVLQPSPLSLLLSLENGIYRYNWT